MHTKLGCCVAALLVSFGCTTPREDPPRLTPSEGLPARTAEPAEPSSPAEAPPSSARASLAATSDADAGDAATHDVAACVAACEAKHPNGANRARMIDQCWTDHCAACQHMAGNTLHGPTTGSCQTGVYTQAEECSQCTADWCCWAWDGCFQDTECKALNDCAVACGN